MLKNEQACGSRPARFDKYVLQKIKRKRIA